MLEDLAEQTFGSKDSSRRPAPIVLEIEVFFINLLEARLSIVSQIYTSVLKTKVKLIEYAFETLPAWALSMPPSKARKYIQTINNVGGVPQLKKNTLTKNALLLFLDLPPCPAFLVFKKVRHREF